MASPISVGEVLEIAKHVVHLYKQCRDAPKEIALAADKVDYVVTILEAIKSPKDQPTFLSTPKGRKLKQVLEREISRLKESLKELLQVIEKWKNSSKNLVKRSWVILVVVRDIPCLKDDLDAQMRSIDRILDRATDKGVKLDQAQFDALLKAAQRPPRDSSTSAARKKSEWKAVKSAFDTSGVSKSAASFDSSQKQKLFAALNDAGFSKEQAENIVRFYEEQSQNEQPVHSPSPKLGTGVDPSFKGPSPSPSKNPIKGTSPPPKAPFKDSLPVHGAKPNTSKGLSPSPSPKPGIGIIPEGAFQSPEIVPIDSPLETKSSEDIEILIVDFYNGSRSIIAQTYLELVRAWTANNGGPWLFKHVDSAGLKVGAPSSITARLLPNPSSLAEPGNPAIAEAIDAMAGDSSYFQTDDQPREKWRIIQRMKEHRSRGIDAIDFCRYRYILTFNRASIALLKQLYEQVLEEDPSEFRTKQAASLVLISTPDPVGIASIKHLVPPIRKGIKTFLSQRLGWSRPASSIFSGGLRTWFVLLQGLEHKKQVEGHDGSNLKWIETVTECRVHIELTREQGYVASIVGSKKAITGAKEMVVSSFQS